MTENNNTSPSQTNNNNTSPDPTPISQLEKRYLDIKKSNKQDISNNDLWKIFEYFSCIKLTEEYGKQFYEYNDIEPNFKE